MPVVINEFEAVAEAPQQPAGEADTGGNKDRGSEDLESTDVMPLLRALEARALRAWAH